MWDGGEILQSIRILCWKEADSSALWSIPPFELRNANTQQEDPSKNGSHQTPIISSHKIGARGLPGGSKEGIVSHRNDRLLLWVCSTGTSVSDAAE
ncbi:hypothetical protein CDAR_370341 [Caerostris darwini]|uniref:Uncharacterized protein n=1 Tax=Caerostris darwini TaxID=1538125 RepID=A0AAV4NLV9_9ARAC|nr:hypothetical protein CDAR_370341 [Caerostris darwini]